MRDYKKKCNMTLYKYVVKDKKVTGYNKIDEAIYMICHALLNLSTIFFSGIFWNNELTNILFVFFIGALGIIRAESFYRAKLLRLKD